MSQPETLLALLEDLLDLDSGNLREDAVLVDLPGWDSVNQMRILVQFEKTLGNPVDLDAFMAARTVHDVLAVVAGTAASETVGRPA